MEGPRVSSETSFVSKQLKLEPELVSALFETRRLFRLFRFNSKTGSFGVSKQPKQRKTNQNSSKFGKISIFLIPHTISSVCFRISTFLIPHTISSGYFSCFDTSPKHRNKPKQTGKFFLVFQRSKPKNNWNRLSFGLFRLEPRKKINGFEDPLKYNVFWRFFRFV